MRTSHLFFRQNKDSVTFPKKNLNGKICLSPFVSVEVGLSGEIRLCGCSHWMPITIGNIFENTLPELLGNLTAQKIRQSIIDGTYVYCDENSCGIIRNDFLNSLDTLPESVTWQIQDSSRFLMPNEIFISVDQTCNLSCPSCRMEVIKPTSEEKKQREKLAKTLRDNIFAQPTDQEINLTISTTGELFASNLLLSFLNGISLDQFPNVKLLIQSNGLLCKKNWKKLGALQNSVKQITVTIDAAKPETYEKLRRGGTWNEIMSAMTWLQKKKKENNMKLYTRIVVQKDNYKEIEDFYKLSKQFDADRIEYSRIKNWYTMSPEQWADVDVLNPSHSLYHEAAKCLDSIKDLPDVVTWG